MKETATGKGKKKSLWGLFMESIAKSNDGCGPGCGCHAVDEKKATDSKVVGDGKKK